MSTLTLTTPRYPSTSYDVAPDSPVAVSFLRDNADKLVVVEKYTFLLALNYECPMCVAELQTKGVVVDEWVVVADYFRDLTGWCDFEQKIEYGSDERLVLAPKAWVDTFRVDFTFEDLAAGEGYQDYV